MGYPGGKSGAGVYHRLVNSFPPHSVYIEPFLGGGAVLRNKRPAALNIGIDLDPAVIVGWYIAACQCSWLRLTDCSADPLVFSGVVSGSAILAGGDGAANWPEPVPVRAGDQGASAIVTRAAGLVMSGDGAPRYEFAAGDALGFLTRYRFSGNELVYCDPPYLAAVRSDPRRRYYRFDMPGPAEHERLLKVLRGLPCQVVVSGYWSQLYGDLLAGWRLERFRTTTRGLVLASECVWFNFPAPAVLHEYTYVGRNFRERERIKRKQKRWVAKLEKMNGLERAALLEALRQVGIEADPRQLGR